MWFFRAANVNELLLAAVVANQGRLHCRHISSMRRIRTEHRTSVLVSTCCNPGRHLGLGDRESLG